MADNRLVHNTTLSPVVVSSEGRRVLGCTTDTIDITEPRAQNHLADGTLILVTDPHTETTATPRTGLRESSKTKTNTTNGE